MRPDDLRGRARDSYEIWRRLGLSEQAAMDVLREDGLIPMGDHDRLVANFVSLGLSASEALTAAHGRSGGMHTPTGQVASAASLAEETTESRALVETVQELAVGALRRGTVSPRFGETRELAAVREAAWRVILKLPPTTAATLWAVRVIEAAFPDVNLSDSQRSSGLLKGGSVPKSSSKTVRS
jgi:hypothetical protein